MKCSYLSEMINHCLQQYVLSILFQRHNFFIVIIMVNMSSLFLAVNFCATQIRNKHYDGFSSITFFCHFSPCCSFRIKSPGEVMVIVLIVRFSLRSNSDLFAFCYVPIFPWLYVSALLLFSFLWLILFF